MSLLSELGRTDEAVELLRDDATNDQTVELLGLAEQLLRHGDHHAAAELADTLRGENLVGSDRFRLAELRLESGLVNEAIDELEFLLGAAEASTHRRAAFMLGDVYRSYEMSDAASSMYERAGVDNDVYWSPKAAERLDALRDDATRLASETGGESDSKTQGAGQKSDPAAAQVPATTKAAGQKSDPAAVQVPATTKAAGQKSDPAAVQVPATTKAAGQKSDPAAAQVPATTKAAGQKSDPAAVQVPATTKAAGQKSDPVVVVLASVEPESEAATAGGAVERQVDPIVIELETASALKAEQAARPGPATFTMSTVQVTDGAGDGPTTREPSPLGGDSAEAANAEPGNTGGSETDVASLVDPAIEDPEQGSQTGSGAASAEPDEYLNPYAALAPDGHSSDVAPSNRNPYAELAPNYDGDLFEPDSEIEPGDWESMLDDWPDQPSGRSETAKRSGKRPSPFSRYT